MNRKFFYIVGFIFIFISGYALHYVYGIFPNSKIVAVFSPVNESTWEHLKLLFWPFTLFSAADYLLFGKRDKNFVSAKTVSVFCGLAFIIVFFYTYSGILGFNLLLADIFDFAAACAFALFVNFKISNNESEYTDELSMGIIYVFIALCFFMWTFSPPDLGIFWG